MDHDTKRRSGFIANANPMRSKSAVILTCGRPVPGPLKRRAGLVADLDPMWSKSAVILTCGRPVPGPLKRRAGLVADLDPMRSKSALDGIPLWDIKAHTALGLKSLKPKNALHFFRESPMAAYRFRKSEIHGTGII